MKKTHTTASPSWRTPPEACPDLNFVVRDLQRAFLRVADNLRWYEQSWLGVPIWQLADDLMALQRIVFDPNPKWIVETGTKFGGSAIFFGSLLAMMGRVPAAGGGVITVDVHETAEARELLLEKPHRLASFVRQRLPLDPSSCRLTGVVRLTPLTLVRCGKMTRVRGHFCHNRPPAGNLLQLHVVLRARDR